MFGVKFLIFGTVLLLYVWMGCMREVSPIVYLVGAVTKGTFRSDCPDRGIDLGVRPDSERLIWYP